jgi:death-on-curing protein
VTYFLTRKDVLSVADRFATVLADVGLLDAAVARPQAAVGGDDAYPTIWDKAGALLHSLAANQQFIDGNKRVAWNAMELFLDLNGYEIDPPVQEAHQFMVAIDHRGRWQDLSDWLQSRERRSSPT